MPVWIEVLPVPSRLTVALMLVSLVSLFIFAILGAEHFLKLLPIGTHQYDKFIKPSEVNNWSRSASMELVDSTGIHYNPLTKNYSLGKNLDVNYIMCFRKLSDE